MFKQVKLRWNPLRGGPGGAKGKVSLASGGYGSPGICVVAANPSRVSAVLKSWIGGCAPWSQSGVESWNRQFSVAGLAQKQPSAPRGAAVEVKSHDYSWTTLLFRGPGANVVHGLDDDGRFSAARLRQGLRLNLLYDSSTPKRGTTDFYGDFDGGRWGHSQTINHRVLDALYGDSPISADVVPGLWASQLNLSDRSGTLQDGLHNQVRKSTTVRPHLLGF
jgi:hypothetical protein